MTTPHSNICAGCSTASRSCRGSSVFNERVVPGVARAVARVAHRTGVARRRRRLDLGAV